MILFWMLACHNQIRKDYDLEKEAVLREAPPLQKNWKPDLLLRLDYQAISRIAKRYIEEEIQDYKPLKKQFLGNTFTAKPKLKLTELKLSDAKAKDEIQFRAKISGDFVLSWGPFKETLRSKSTLRGVAKIKIDNGESTLSFAKLDQISITINTLGGKNIAPLLEEWLKGEFLRSQTISLGSIDLSQLYLRGIRINSTPTSTNIEMRSDLPDTRNISPATLSMKHDWELQLHQDVLLGWSRRIAFQRGILEHDLAIDPRRFDVTDQEFDIDLRLWKLDGFSKWWREYSIHGDIGAPKGQLKLTATKITKEDDSKGVTVADPLLLLAESLLLDDLTEKLNYALPRQKKTTMNGLHWHFKLRQFKGHGDNITFQGSWKEVKQKAKK